MQGKGSPLNFNIIVILQFFNTPGNEIAPGSDIVGKYFENLHGLAPFMESVYSNTIGSKKRLSMVEN